jgi:hypothetical protein
VPQPPPPARAQAPEDPTADSLARIEQLLTSEVRALRVLVQLLVDKGVISRDEYIARVKGSGKSSS